MNSITYGSVCSGIEAASVAWEPMGWRAAWFAEIEPFPSAVLKYHWPYVSNHGDMLPLPSKVANKEVAAPDVLVGGTPCQAFSIAGRRGSLEDERGALTLAYVDLLNRIDEVRRHDGREECIAVWENVPGVLNTKDNAFGCFLAGLAGESEPLQPSGKRWTNAGCVFGPQRAVAWRVLDAQYLGVAQRRRRVFVVASARDGFDPSEILFESKGVRRDTPPSREAGQGFAADVVPSLTASGRGVERCGESRGQDPVVAMPILEPGARTGKSTTDIRAGMGVGQDGDPMYTLQAGKQQGVAHTVALRGRDGGATAEVGGEVATALRASSGGGDKPHVLQGFRMVAFGEYADDETASTTKARDYKDATDLAVAVTGNLAHTLNTANNGKGCSEYGTGRGVPTIAFHTNAQACQLPTEQRDTTISDSLTCSQQAAAAIGLSVRRLTPKECERLQGFPDTHTDVPYRGKDAADGPRYKAVGNSMAVPCMKFIGLRIAAQITKRQSTPMPPVPSPPPSGASLMNSTTLLKELDRLRGLKNKERESELKTLLQDPFARDVCQAALDPFTRYGVNKVPMPDEPASLNWQFGDQTWKLLHKLAGRHLTGNAAHQAIVDEMLQLSDESRELLRRILTKDLRCGAGPKTFNKAYPGLVDVFEMQTCHGYEASRITQWPVVCEVKYDGTRVACIWEDQTLTIVSRNGLPMPGFEPFAKEMEGHLHNLLICGVAIPDMVLDGEMDSVAGFYETVGGARRKDGQGEFILRLFDAVPLAQFKTGECQRTWQQRSKVAATLVQALGADNITYGTGMECHDDAQVRHVYEHARSKNHEGIIIKQPDAPYECKRGYHWMKLKPKATVDIPIVGFEVGTGRNARRLGAAICDLEGVEVKVGTGWSDEERTNVWLNQDQCLGQMIEVEYAEKTPDGSLRHPRFVRWRPDKTAEDGPGV